MNITANIQGALPNGDVFIGWGPRRVDVTVTNIPPGQNVVLTVTSTGPVGQLVFVSSPSDSPSASLQVPIDSGTGKASFYVAGKFQSPSVDKNDAQMTLDDTAGTSIQVPMSVRVRKNANKLSQSERDRFLLAYAKVNGDSRGLYQALRDMHTGASNLNIHGGPHFLPWHRSFVLDLEREIQSFDAMAAMPYWKFDEPTSTVFTEDFMGTTTENDGATFAASNPLHLWQVDNGSGVERTLDPNRPDVRSEQGTLGLGALFVRFARMEGNPHGFAHVQFSGPISDITQAVRDPLFFLLHCNVDRLWAKWQYLTNRYDATSTASYPQIGRSPNADDMANMTLDTLWPWDGVSGGQRPPTAPGGPMPDSPQVSAPGPNPTIASMIDYQGRNDPANLLGFDYDDVPYWK